MITKDIIFLDLDGNLIKTKSGETFPKNYDDWKINTPVINFIEKYRKDLYNPLFILVTNQLGIDRGHVDENLFKEKVARIEEKLPFKFDDVFIADTIYSGFRKPRVTGIQKHLKSLGVIPSVKSCMIGDAGGRKDSKGKKIDFSDSDLKFAENLGILFFHSDDCK